MGELQPGRIIGFDRRSVEEKARLDQLRLECLKLANGAEPLLLSGSTRSESLMAAAKEMFEFVTEAPKRLELFAVKRVDTAEVNETCGALEYLDISGSYVRWGFEAHAYRFRSRAEAEAAIACRVENLDGIGGIGMVVSLPSYMDPF